MDINNTPTQQQNSNIRDIDLDKPISMIAVAGTLYCVFSVPLTASLLIGAASTMVTSYFSDDNNSTLLYEKKISITNPTLMKFIDYCYPKESKDS